MRFNKLVSLIPIVQRRRPHRRQATVSPHSYHFIAVPRREKTLLGTSKGRL